MGFSGYGFSKKNTFGMYPLPKPKSIKYGNTPWAFKQDQKGRSKISEDISKYLYNWIIHHPKVVQSPIANDCLKVEIDGYTEPQIDTKTILQASVRELHNNLVSATKDGGLTEERDKDNNIIISESTLRSLLLPQLKNVIKIQGHVWLQILHV